MWLHMNLVTTACQGTEHGIEHSTSPVLTVLLPLRLSVIFLKKEFVSQLEYNKKEVRMKSNPLQCY